jgi:hypothetical protein
MRAGSRVVSLAAALAFAASGCAAVEAETTTVTTTVGTEDAVGATGGDGPSGGSPPSRGPHGTMGIRYFGPLQLGMMEARVTEEIGEPDRVQDVNFGTGAAPQTNWIWNLGGDTVTLKFDNSNGTLAGWSTDSPEIASAPGVSVGDSIKPVMEEFSEELVADPQGSGSLVLSEGAPGSSPALTFDLAEGENEIVQITGGALVQPAGD